MEDDTTPPASDPPPDAGERVGTAPRPPDAEVVGPKRLTRSHDRRLAGVAGGIAEYLQVDPTLIRLGFIVAAFLGGVGIAAYLIAWVVLPEAGGQSPSSGRTISGNLKLAAVLMVAVLIVAASDNPARNLWVPVALVAGGIYVLSRQPGPLSSSTRTTPPPPPPSPPLGDRSAASTWGAASPTVAERAPEPAEREPSLVTRLVLSLVAVIVAAGIALHELGWSDVEAPHVIGAALIAVGGGLVAGSFLGQMRGLVALGITLSVALAVAMFAAPLLGDGVGGRTYTISNVSALDPDYVHGIGELVVDLRSLDVADGESIAVHLDLGIGNAVVRLPDDVDALVAGDVGLGELELFGERTSGVGNRAEVNQDVDGTSASIIIDLEVGIGHGEVRRG